MKRFGADNHWRIIGCGVFLALTLVSRAQMSPGPQIIKQFRVPDFDENGVKKSEVVGEEAEILPDGQVKIKGLKIVMFKDGQVEATIEADQCTFDRKEKRAFSNSAVSIDRGSMRVTGRGFRWSSEGQRIEILNESRVVLKNTSVWKEVGVR